MSAADEIRGAAFLDAAAEACRPATREERRQTMLTIYGQMSGVAQSYHAITINLNVMLITANIFLTGHLIAAAGARTGQSRILLALVPVLIASVGLLITRMIRRQYLTITHVIRAIDDANGVFEPGLYIPGQSLYPSAWQAFGSRRWHEIEFSVFPPLQAFFGLVASALILGK